MNHRYRDFKGTPGQLGMCRPRDMIEVLSDECGVPAPPGDPRIAVTTTSNGPLSRPLTPALSHLFNSLLVSTMTTVSTVTTVSWAQHTTL